MPEDLIDCRAVRSRKRRLHWLGGRAAWPVRKRRRRYRVSRRGRRVVGASAGQGAAGASGRRGSPRRRKLHSRLRRAPGRCYQPISRAPKSRRGGFGRTCFTGSTSSASTCRRCAIASTTSRCWPRVSGSRPPNVLAAERCSDRACSRRWRGMIGRATFESCRTCSRRWSWRCLRAVSSARPRLPRGDCPSRRGDAARVARERAAQVRTAIRPRGARARGRPSRPHGCRPGPQPSGPRQTDAASSSRCLGISSDGSC